VDQLTRVEFVTEAKDQASGTYALVIRKDMYFDKVITDYPASNRPHQLEQLQTEMSCLTIVWATIEGIALHKIPV
jgi:hypothetical protein